MATSPVDSEAREFAVLAVRDLRVKMNQVLAQIANHARSLSQVLQSSDEVGLNQLYVLKVLESFSKIGKIRARQVLDELQIDHKTKMSSLSADQKASLLEALQ